MARPLQGSVLARYPGPAVRAGWKAWRQAAGWQGPPAGWARDPQLHLALWCALPVWGVLLILGDPWLRLPTGLQAWLSLVLVQPVLEELVLRGMVQGLLLTGFRAPAPRRWPVRPGAANVLTTAVFVALHLPHQPWPWALAVAAPSLLLGHLRERFDSVWPGVLLHAVYNLGFGLIAWVAYRPAQA